MRSLYVSYVSLGAQQPPTPSPLQARDAGAGKTGRASSNARGQAWGWKGQDAVSPQTRGVSKGGAPEPAPPARGPHPATTLPTCPQLRTIDCEVHPGAVSGVVLRAVLVQEEHSALVPALVFRPEPLNPERRPLLQPDSPCGRSPKPWSRWLFSELKSKALSPAVTLIQ